MEILYYYYFRMNNPVWYRIIIIKDLKARARGW